MVLVRPLKPKMRFIFHGNENGFENSVLRTFEGLKSAQDRDRTERLAVSGAISDGTTNANAPNAYFTTYRLPLSV